MVVNELESIEAYIHALFPTSATYKQTAPRQPKSDTFVIRLITDGRTTETTASTLIERTYQVIYYGVDPSSILARMDTLSDAIYQNEQIPINASTRFIRVGAFSFSAPFQTENEIYASIGVMQTTTRVLKAEPNYPLIGAVEFTITLDL